MLPLSLFALSDAEEKLAFWDQLFQLAYPAYFAAFALAGALLIASVFVRPADPSSRLRAKLFHGGLVALLLLCALSHQTVIDTNRGFIGDREKRYDKMMSELERRTDKEEVLRSQYLYMPTGDSLAYITLGNTAIAADYLWLTSNQYVATSFHRGHKFEMLSRFYNAMLDMQPDWIDAHVNAGKVLSALEPDRFAVEKFYIRAIVHNPENWRLPYEAGRLFVVPPMNLDDRELFAERGVGWFKTALARKTFPPEMAAATTKLMALMSAEAGYYVAADEMLFEQATDPNGDRNLREIAARDWMNVHSIRQAKDLEKLSAIYKEQTGRLAPDLASLLKPLPPEAAADFQEDAFGFPFDYDPATGKVESRGVKVRKALTLKNMIETLISFYRGEHQDHPPATLDDLHAFVLTYYTGANQPGHALVEAMGKDLDPRRSPLGHWDYDAASGTIVLPDWCNSNRLYQKADAVLDLARKKTVSPPKQTP